MTRGQKDLGFAGITAASTTKSSFCGHFDKRLCRESRKSRSRPGAPAESGNAEAQAPRREAESGKRASWRTAHARNWGTNKMAGTSFAPSSLFPSPSPGAPSPIINFI